MAKVKRPRDPNQLAKLMVDIATGDASDIMIAFVLIIIGTWGYSWLLSGIWLDRFTGGTAKA